MSLTQSSFFCSRLIPVFITSVYATPFPASKDTTSKLQRTPADFFKVDIPILELGYFFGSFSEKYASCDGKNTV